MEKVSAYRGRFAPSPTGELHFGSLVAALGSYLDAKSQDGEWLLRMEDLDQTREVPGAADEILRTLDAFGFAWDGEVVYQSRRTEAYRYALEQLRREGVVYPCECSRKTIMVDGRVGVEGVVYSGACRDREIDESRARALRLATTSDLILLNDLIQRDLSQNVRNDVGDFVIRRADGFHAYQLAVVVDDAWQGITHVVRGADLLLSTPRQIYLQRLLELHQPEYAHLPLAVDSAGNKLSKQAASLPVRREEPLAALAKAWTYLRQPLPPETFSGVEAFWQWAVAHWDRSLVPRQIKIKI